MPSRTGSSRCVGCGPNPVVGEAQRSPNSCVGSTLMTASGPTARPCLSLVGRWPWRVRLRRSRALESPQRRVEQLDGSGIRGSSADPRRADAGRGRAARRGQTLLHCIAYRGGALGRRFEPVERGGGSRGSFVGAADLRGAPGLVCDLSPRRGPAPALAQSRARAARASRGAWLRPLHRRAAYG